MKETILAIFAVLLIIAYFKIAYSLDDKKFKSNILWVFVMMAISVFTLFICIILIKQNNILEEQVKNKCPEYKHIDAYILKK